MIDDNRLFKYLQFHQELNGEIARLSTKADTHQQLRDSYRDEIRRYQNANRTLQWRVLDLEKENRTLKRYAELVGLSSSFCRSLTLVPTRSRLNYTCNN